LVHLYRFALKSDRLSSTKARGSFVALLEKQSFVVTKARQVSWCCAAILRANNHKGIGSMLPDVKDKAHKYSLKMMQGISRLLSLPVNPTPHLLGQFISG
jgi:hypothetical protein